MSIYGPGEPPKPKHSESPKDLHHYAKKAYVDANKVSKNGDAMLGVLNMNGFAIRNLPKVPQADTDACSGAYAQAIGRDCVTRDGNQGMLADLDMGGNRVTKVQNPANSRDAANKRYVDSAVGNVKQCVTIWAERSGPFDTPYQFSFGGSSTGRDQRYCGYTMMTSGRVMRMGLAATTNLGLAGVITVTLVVNGERNGQFHITKNREQFAAYTVFEPPLEISTGDRINFMSGQEDQADPKATAIIVTLLIQLDL